MVKAQIHAGGRGKAGGVKLVHSLDEVGKEAAPARLHSGDASDRAAGKQVNRLYIEEGSTIQRELYRSLLVDRESSRGARVGSVAGGMDIEEVARTQPAKIVTFSIDPATGIIPHHGRRLAQALGLRRHLAKQTETLVSRLYDAFTAMT